MKPQWMFNWRRKLWLVWGAALGAQFYHTVRWHEAWLWLWHSVCHRIILSSPLAWLTETRPRSGLQTSSSDLAWSFLHLLTGDWRLQHSHHLCCCRKLAGIVAAADWQPEPTWIQIQVIMLVPHFITSLCPDSWLHSISIQELWMFILQPRNGSLGKPKWCEIISNCCQAVRYEQRTTQICLLICQKISKLAN